jgi:hypothetical protein
MSSFQKKTARKANIDGVLNNLLKFFEMTIPAGTEKPVHNLVEDMLASDQV